MNDSSNGARSLRTQHQRVQPVSKAPIISRLLVLLFTFSAAIALAQETRGPAHREAKPRGMATLFQRGQDALNQGHLDEAEQDFRWSWMQILDWAGPMRISALSTCGENSGPLPI